MSRKSFYEEIQREIDLEYEYIKIDKIVCEERPISCNTLNEEIEKNFRKWKHKDNYTSFSELRKKLEFSLNYSSNNRCYYVPTNISIDLNRFFTYCEMIINIMLGTISDLNPKLDERIKHVMDVIHADIAKLNHEIYRTDNDKYLIVQCNAAASSVADIVEADIIQPIIEYNHYLLKGDISKKRTLLKKIADDLEANRGRLDHVNNAIKDDLFFLFNNMNIRHNNSDKSSKKFNPYYAELSS